MQNIVKKTKITITATALTALLLVSACDKHALLREETEVVAPQERIVLEKEYALAHIPMNSIQPDTIGSIATHFKNNASGPLYIAMGYKAEKGSASEQYARNHTHKIAKRLNKHGIKNIVMSVLPHEAPRDEAVIGYSTLSVHKSKRCKKAQMPGYDGVTRVEIGEYGIGCQTDYLTAQQIANPADLQGKELGAHRADARRTANILDNGYRTGETLEYLPGFVLSELGSGGG